MKSYQCDQNYICPYVENLLMCESLQKFITVMKICCWHKNSFIDYVDENMNLWLRFDLINFHHWSGNFPLLKAQWCDETWSVWFRLIALMKIHI